MKLQLYSDIHAEFGHDFVPEWDAASEVLLLAGDIHICRKLEAFESFLAKLKGWKQIYIIMGNHEAYGELYQQAVSDMQYTCAKLGIHFLNDDLVNLGGNKWLFGGTMWTNLSNPLVANQVQVSLNDYYKIKWFDGTNYFKLNTRITTQMFFKFKERLNNALHELPKDAEVIVMSHMAPHINSSLGCYKANALTPAYFTDMSEFFGDQVKYWVHGHMHNSSDYTVNGTRVLANPYGYYDGVSDKVSYFDQRNPNFNERGIGFEL